MNRKWEASEWWKIPCLEGFFFEMTQALCAAIMYIGFGNYKDAIKHLKRFKVLVGPSGLFKEIRPSELIEYRDRESFVKFCILDPCDYIINLLEQVINGKKVNFKEVWIEITNILSRFNMHYMYAKTKVDFAGSYKPAFEIFEKEGI